MSPQNAFCSRHCHCHCGYHLLLFRKPHECSESWRRCCPLLGIPVSLLRFLLLMLSSILAGCVVSYAGLLSFVGLIVPHIARRLFGNDMRLLVPLCVLLGASFVLFCDTLGRVIAAPYELPAGIILSFVGGPFFLYLLLERKEAAESMLKFNSVSIGYHKVPLIKICPLKFPPAASQPS